MAGLDAFLPKSRTAVRGGLLMAMLVAALLLSMAARAAEPAGRIIASMGSITASGGDEGTRSLGRRDLFYAGETLTTGPRGRAQLKFTDGGLMTLRPNTEFVIEAYEYSAASGTGNQRMRLNTGSLRADTSGSAISRNAIAQAGNRAASRDIYSLRTPVAVIGLRGTLWDAVQEGTSGPLTVGVTDGEVEVEALRSGRIAQLGPRRNFRYARINTDGSIEELVETPSNLEDTPDLEDPGDPEETGDPDSGGVEGSDLAAGGPVDTGGAGNTTLEIVDQSTNPEASGDIGAPLPDVTPGLTAAEQAALVNASSVGMVAGAPIPVVFSDSGGDSVATDAAPLGSAFTVDPLAAPPLLTTVDGFEVIQAGVQTEGGLAAYDANGAPIFAFFGGAGFAPGFEEDYLAGAPAERQNELDFADMFFSVRSGTSTIEQDVFGISGLDWGVFAAPVVIAADIDDGSLNLVSSRDLLFVIGDPADPLSTGNLGGLTGSLPFLLAGADVRSLDFDVVDVFGSASLNISNASIFGILDILMVDPVTGADLTYITDWSGDVQNGLLVNTNVFVELEDSSQSGVFDGEGSVAGFFTGEQASALQLAFDYSTPGVPGSDVVGLALLQNHRLLAGEASALAAGRYFVAVDCCRGDTFQPSAIFAGRATDPAAAGGDLIGGVNSLSGPQSMNDPTFTDTPPLAIIRNRGTVASFTPSVSGAGLESVTGSIWEATGGSEAIGLFDAANGDLLGLDTGRYLIATGIPTTATLTGQFDYGNAALIDGFSHDGFEGTGGLVGTPIDPLGFDFGFSVDFTNGTVSDGFLIVPVSGTDGFDVTFDGIFTGANGFPGLEVRNPQGTFDGTDPVDFTFDPVSGFFTGSNGEGFVGAFGLVALNTAQTMAAGTFTAQQLPDIGGALTAAELAAMSEGFFFIGTDCCFEPGITGDNLPGVFGGPAIDPLPTSGVGGVFGFSFSEATGELASADEVQFGDVPPDLVLRLAGGTAVFNGEQVPPLTATGEEWLGSPSPLEVYDAVGGSLINSYADSFYYLAALPSTLASLTGTARYEQFSVQTGTFENSTGSIPRQSLSGIDMSFNIDFSNGQFDGGVLVAETAGPGFGFTGLFDGQIVDVDGAAFADIQFFDGTYVGAVSAGSAIDLANSSIGGFFTDDAFASAFHLQSDGADPIIAAGTVLLREVDLSLTSAELLSMQEGRVFVGVDCCSFGGTGGGPVTDPLFGPGDGTGLVAGLNVDPLDLENLDPTQPGFLDIVPDQIVRIGGAQVSLLDQSFSVPPESGLTVVGWDGESNFSPPLVVDPSTGEIIDVADYNVLVMTAFPTAIANLSGFATYAGATQVQAVDPLNPPTLISTLEIFKLTPGGSGGGGAVSFNVDFATGGVYAGNLFSTEFTSGSEDFGFNVFFEGQVALTNGNPFVSINILDGYFDETEPLDLELSEIDGFFSGTNGELFVGAFHLVGAETGATTGGVFSIGNNLLPDVRIAAEDAQDWGLVGIAAIDQLDDLGEPASLSGLSPILLGRSSEAAGVGEFFLGANVYRDASGVQTARQDFWTQPFDFILREGLAGADPLLADPDVTVNGVSFSGSGYAVSWGAWNSSPSFPSRAEDDPTDNLSFINLETKTFFASLTPTHALDMPTTGTFDYGGTLAGGTASVIGAGGGNLSGAVEAALNQFSISFAIDFLNAAVTGGAITVGYGSASGAVWNGEFDGFLNGPVLDVQLSSLTVDDLAGSPIGNGDLTSSSLTGVLTGPAGQRVVGGFSFVGDDGSPPFEPSAFESVRGLFAVDGVPQL